ncbi:MAG: transposase, partial [Defluviitaleaceae bacterium]|nr:transposase [Defluviitaleaceae bacterium]
MKRIIYVGMDVHKESYTLCCFTPEEDETFYHQTITSDYKLILKYVERITKIYKKENPDEELTFKCGYEAGCLGYTLYHQLNRAGIDCVILAPSTMSTTSNTRIKTDKRDAENIAKCLAFRTFSKVHIPTAEDEEIKEYIRMRNAKKQLLKSTKQQILALVLRHGYRYDGTVNNWTAKHIAWLRSLNLGGVLQETLSEYLTTFDYLMDKVERL